MKVESVLVLFVPFRRKLSISSRMKQEIDNFLGLWYKHVKSDNLEALYIHLGYKTFTRLFIESEPSLCLNETCCGYRLSSFVGTVTEFKPGKSYYQYCLGNGFCKSKVTIEGNKLLQIQEGKKKIVTVMDFDNDLLTVTIVSDHVIATRFFESIDDVYC